MSKDVVCRWLASAGCDHDVALSPVFEGGVDWESVDPGSYEAVVFVCGPAAGTQVQLLARRFRGCCLLGLNVSIPDVGEAALFDVLLERDGRGPARPDLAFGAPRALLPVLGVVRSHAQGEYGDRGAHDAAHAAIDRLLSRTEASFLEVDTRVDPREVGIRTCAEIESLFARLDAVVTTRLHGLVLALRNGLPAVAIDPIRGGAKVLAQARAVGWPAAMALEEVTDAGLDDALAFCLTPGASSQARACAVHAARAVADLEAVFGRALPTV